jgi:hypothetical protein
VLEKELLCHDDIMMQVQALGHMHTLGRALLSSTAVLHIWPGV